jgi:trimeric autotransporter adhesin
MRSNYPLTTGCNIAAGGGAWNRSSSRNLKEMFIPVNGEEVLQRLRATPVATWNYIAEGREVRHMGPMAEDFRAAFGLGDEDTSIGVLDIAGVNMAAVQALERRTAELREELADRDRRIAELEARMLRLEALLTRGNDD